MKWHSVLCVTVSRDERGESWGRGCRRQQLPPHLWHPERRPADGLLHHAPPDDVLWTDTAGLAADSSRITISCCWSPNKERLAQSFSSIFSSCSHFSGSGLWGFWLCGRYVQSSFEVIREAALVQFLHAEGSRSRVWRPCLLSVSILSAQLPWKRPETSTEAVAKDGYTWCAILTQSLRCSPFRQTALQASFLNLHPHHPSWLMPLSLHSGQLRFLASVYIMNPLWKAQSGNSSCTPNISDSQALHVPFSFLHSIPKSKC